MAISLELKARAAAGRIATLRTPHGTVTTPTLLPVVNPNLRLIPPRDMRRLFGAEMVITNSYVIRKHDALREAALSKGVHHVIDWDGPVMTDSGTFQQYVYGDVDVGNAEIVSFQRDIGVDVGTVLDVFSTPDRTFQEAKEDLEETARRAQEAAGEKGDMALAATVQGGVHPLLREESARRMAPFGDLYPIGGVVPIMERQRYDDLVRVILGAQRGLPPGKPVHLFGCGHPLVFPVAAALGCDLFDSSAYAKYAKDGRMMMPEGTLLLSDLEESPCACPVCSAHTPAELRRLADGDRTRLLAEHNLHVSFAELRRVRAAIREGTLWELVERRATANPMMLAALDVLKEEPHKIQLERSEPVSGDRALFYTGPHTVHRPLLYRLHHRLRERYAPPERERVIVFGETERPFASRLMDRVATHQAGHDCHFVVDSFLGPVPLELEGMYPFGQSVVPPAVDGATRRSLAGLFTLFMEEKFPVEVVRDGEELEEWTFHSAEELYADPGLALVAQGGGPGMSAFDLDRLRIGAVADMQYGRGTAVALFGSAVEAADRVSFVRSPNNEKVRNVLVDGEHLLSLRAEDGLFSLTDAGARRLHGVLRAPRLRVVVNDDSVAFNREGKNVMAPFVVAMDGGLRPGDDCLVVDAKDALVAHGRVILAPHEVGSFSRGVAVRVRGGLSA